MNEHSIYRHSLRTIVALVVAITSPVVYSQSSTPKFEVGGQFTSFQVNAHSVICFDVCLVGSERNYTDPGFGGRFTYNFTKHIGLEAAGNFFPREHRRYDFFGLSGNMFQAQFGIKAGKRLHKVGVFGKFRPGFMSFSKVSHLVGTSTITFDGQQFTLGQFAEKRSAFFSTELGGVVEFYPSRRLVARVDIGDTILRYGEIKVPGISLSGAITRIPPETRHNLQFSVGMAVRF